MSQESRKHPNEVLIEKLMEVNTQLVQQNQALAAILVAALGQTNPYLVDPRYAGNPQAYYPEDEIKADADQMLEDGLIDTTQYQEYLRRAGFDTTDVNVVS